MHYAQAQDMTVQNQRHSEVTYNAALNDYLQLCLSSSDIRLGPMLGA